MAFIPKSSIVTTLTSIFFLTFEINKAIIDFRDFSDVLLCSIAIICLSIPFIKYTKSQQALT